MATLAAGAHKLADAVAKHDVAAVKSLLSKAAVLHQGNSTPLEMGKDEDVKAFEEQWSKVTVGSSELLAAAVNEDEKTSFAFVWYKDVGSVVGEAPPPGTGVAAIWHAVWTADGSAVRELVVHSTTLIPKAEDAADDDSGISAFDPALFARSASNGAVDGAAAARVTAAAHAFCGLYEHADPDLVPAALAEDFLEWSPVTGKHFRGRASVQDNLKMHAKYWKTAKTTHLTAVADAESGFLAWAMSGHLAGKEGDFDTSAPPQLYAGICFMLVDAEGLVTRSVHLDLPEPKTAPLGWAGI